MNSLKLVGSFAALLALAGCATTSSYNDLGGYYDEPAPAYGYYPAYPAPAYVAPPVYYYGGGSYYRDDYHHHHGHDRHHGGDRSDYAGRHPPVGKPATATPPPAKPTAAKPPPPKPSGMVHRDSSPKPSSAKSSSWTRRNGD